MTYAATSQFEPSAPVPTVLPRGRGEGRLRFEQRGARTIISERYQQGTVKLRTPRARDAEAVLINLGGGLTGGDRMALSAHVGAGASATLTTQACEKIYRSLGDDAHVHFRFCLEGAARLDWLGQPTILFDRGRISRTTEIEMAADACFLGLEAMVLGRTAMGEDVVAGKVSDRWHIRRDGKLIHAEHFLLDGDLAALRARPAILNGHCALATLRYVSADAEAMLEMVRQLAQSAVAATAMDGLLIVRAVAPTGQALISAITPIITLLRGASLPRFWTL